jgi:hypothetical protein
MKDESDEVDGRQRMDGVGRELQHKQNIHQRDAAGSMVCGVLGSQHVSGGVRWCREFAWVLAGREWNRANVCVCVCVCLFVSVHKCMCVA